MSDIFVSYKREDEARVGQLMPSQDWTEWFERQLGQSPPGES